MRDASTPFSAKDCPDPSDAPRISRQSYLLAIASSRWRRDFLRRSSLEGSRPSAYGVMLLDIGVTIAA